MYTTMQCRINEDNDLYVVPCNSGLAFEKLQNNVMAYYTSYGGAIFILLTYTEILNIDAK